MVGKRFAPVDRLARARGRSAAARESEGEEVVVGLEAEGFHRIFSGSPEE